VRNTLADILDSGSYLRLLAVQITRQHLLWQKKICLLKCQHWKQGAYNKLTDIILNNILERFSMVKGWYYQLMLIIIW